ncbi:MAG: hypothetical protein EOP09_12565, partial [Proteobacteria bacterium]
MVRPQLKAFWMLSAVASFTSCAHLTRTESTEKLNEPGELAGMTRSEVPTQSQVFATATYHFSMAQAYSTEGQVERAIEEYKLALLYDAKSSVIYSRLAGEYIRKGALTAALETCKDALKVDGGFSDVRLILAGLYA